MAASTKVVDLLTRAGILLQDTTGVRWSTSELLIWLNDGQREVVTIRPQSNVKVQALQLGANNTKQQLPDNCVSLVDIVRNLGEDGSTPGFPVRIVDRTTLDAQVPTWHSDVNISGYVTHYLYDERMPKFFYVYPRSPATTWYVEAVMSILPSDCTSGPIDAIQIDDIYANPLLDYVLYRAYSKDAEATQNATLAANHYQAFIGALGVKTSNEQSQSPNAPVAQ